LLIAGKTGQWNQKWAGVNSGFQRVVGTVDDIQEKPVAIGADRAGQANVRVRFLGQSISFWRLLKCIGGEVLSACFSAICHLAFDFIKSRGVARIWLGRLKPIGKASPYSIGIINCKLRGPALSKIPDPAKDQHLAASPDAGMAGPCFRRID
jgi:hypothetical protein